MAFRPYAHYFVEQPYEKFAKGQDREFTARIRGLSDGQKAGGTQLDKHGEYTEWEKTLNRMKEKAKRQRVKIAMRDEEHEEFVQTQQKLRELRLIVRKRESNHLANQYRLRVNAKVSKPNLQVVLGVLSTCSSRPRNSSFFLTTPEEDTSFRSMRNPTPTPKMPTIDCVTPRRGVRRAGLRAGFI